MSFADASVILSLVVDQAVRGAVAVAVVAALLAVLRVRRAGAELAVWTLVGAGLLVMPLVTLESPALVMTVPGAAVIVTAPVATSTPVAVVSGVRAAASGASVSAVPVAGQPSIPSVPGTTDSGSSRLTTSGRTMFAAVYEAGVILGIARLVFGLVAWRTVRVRARAVEAEISSVARRVADSLNLSRVPRVLESDVTVPCVIGVWRGVVVLPVTWRNWDAATLESVLIHECSHIARRDALARLGAAIYRALLWFSPSAWWLHARVVALTEDASDDAVLERGTDAAAYAATLLCFATRAASTRGAVAMADGRRVERRLLRITRWVPPSDTRARRRPWVAVTLGAPLLVIAAVAKPRAAETVRLPSPSGPPLIIRTIRTTAAPVLPGWISSFSAPESQSAPTPNAVDRVAVNAGQSRVLTLPFDIKRISITNPDIADATAVTPRELLIDGKTPGTISLIVWGDAGARARYDLEVEASPSPQAPPQTGVASDAVRSASRRPSFVVLLFDLQGLPGSDRQEAVDAAKAMVRRQREFQAVGLAPFAWYAVMTTDTNYISASSLTVDDTAVLQALDRVAQMPAAVRQAPAVLDRVLASECHALATKALAPEPIIAAQMDPRLRRLVGLGDVQQATPEVDIFSNGVARGLVAATDPPRFTAPCLAEAPPVLVNWMDHESQQRRDFVAYWTPPRPAPRPITLQLARSSSGAPVRLATTDAAFDGGYVSATVTNQSAKTIRSVTLGAMVTSGGTQRLFTRVGPAVPITSGGHVDIASAVIDPVDFAVLSRDGGSAVVGIVAVDFEDGTRWTGDLPSGGGATLPAASARR